MKEKTNLAAFLNAAAGLLIIVWGLLHIFIVQEVNKELVSSSVNQNIISLIVLSYLGITVMISMNGIIVIYASMKGIKQSKKWAYFVNFTQGILFTFVSLLLLILQPKVSVLNFPPEFILSLAILTDVAISILILAPLIVWRNLFN